MNKKSTISRPIDFVITWVDGDDAEWLEQKNLYYQKEMGVFQKDASTSRYRDWGTLKYLFRGIEEYASWVNKVYFVTWGHCPDWLNKSNPKLKIIRHSPSAEGALF